MKNCQITKASVSAYKFPTDEPESDGTIAWNSTVLILVQLQAGDKTGLGYTYAHEAAAPLIKDLLEKKVIGKEAMALRAIWNELVAAERNLGRVGLAAMALSAIDVAAWDLKAKLLELPLVTLLGGVRESAPIYGSGGFTSYSVQELDRQLGGWAEEGIPRVKMKIGKGVAEDLARIASAKKAIGNDCILMVDANEAYDRRTALALAHRLPEFGVDWFEQPIQAEDREGMAFLRAQFPPGLTLATGEYASDAANFRELILAGACDTLQADATRCRGITGFLDAAALASAFSMPISSHCAPSLHLALGCSVTNFLHGEYFYDHARIEKLAFDGFRAPKAGKISPDLSRPGLGLEWKFLDTEKYRIA